MTVFKYMAIIFSLYIFSCNDFSNNEKNIETSSLKPPINFESIPPDTLQFEEFENLVLFFRNKHDSLDSVTKSIRKRNINRSSNKIDSIMILESSLNKLIKQRNNSIYYFLTHKEKNAQNFKGLMYLVLDWTTPVSVSESLYHEFSSNIQNSPEGKWVFSKIFEREKAENNSVYNLKILDLEFYTSDGKAIKLKEVSTEYILLDFWASWCTPCRHHNRILVKQKDSFTKNMNLSIVAVSLDENKAKWLRASVEDSLNYLNISDLKGFNSVISKELALSTIPYNVLIDKKGNIVANNLWDDRLKDFIFSFPNKTN